MGVELGFGLGLGSGLGLGLGLGSGSGLGLGFAAERLGQLGLPLQELADHAARADVVDEHLGWQPVAWLGLGLG